MENLKNKLSTLEESEHSWTWVVKECSSLLYNAYVGTTIVSSSFKIGKYTFEFVLYPGGTEEENQDYVGLFLKLKDPEEAVITFSLHIGYDTVKMYRMKKCTKLFVSADSVSSHHGLGRFVKRKSLSNRVLKLSRNELVIKCTIYGLDVPETQSRLRILNKLENFFDNETFCDVKIIVGQKTIYAHKLILASGSKVFELMLERSKMLDNQEDVIEINSIDFDVMHRVIRYMYTGKIERIFQNTKELLIAADKYAVAELKSECGKYLCTSLSVNNVIGYYDFAHEYKVGELQDAAQSYLISHGKEIAQLPNLDELLAGTSEYTRRISQCIIKLSKESNRSMF